MTTTRPVHIVAQGPSPQDSMIVEPTQTMTHPCLHRSPMFLSVQNAASLTLLTRYSCRRTGIVLIRNPDERSAATGDHIDENDH